MKATVLLLLAALTLAPAFAQDAKPSEDSVRRLFQEMHTREVFRNAGEQMDSSLRTAMNEETHGQALNAAQQKIRDESRAQLVSIMNEALAWSSMEPLMIQSYRETFTPQEVAAMLKFYDSPTGQSVAAKLPTVSRGMMRLMQQRVRDMIPKIVALKIQTADRIRAAGEPAAAPAQPAPPPH